MYNSDTEILFPVRVAETLKDTRGAEWAALIERLLDDKTDPLERAAFVLLMVRLGGCVACNADSFRAMRGCTQCARQTVRRFRGGDSELMEQFAQSLREVRQYWKRISSESQE